MRSQHPSTTRNMEREQADRREERGAETVLRDAPDFETAAILDGRRLVPLFMSVFAPLRVAKPPFR